MPYTNLTETSESVTRKFSQDIDPIELKWHRDDEDREVESIDGTDWMIQLEDSLPRSLNSKVFIKRHQWHRLIKGTNYIVLKIKKIK